jgi:hypothetical protein
MSMDWLRAPHVSAKDLPNTNIQEKSSVDFSFGDVNNQNIDIHDMRWRESPDDVKEAFKQSRRWRKQNWFIREIIDLKCAFFNYGFRLVAAGGEKEQKKLDDWLRERSAASALLPNGQLNKAGALPSSNGAVVGRYVRDVAMEWFTQNSLISFWRDGQKPSLLMPESVRYTDAMGIEKLYVSMGNTSRDLSTAENADEVEELHVMIERYSAKEIELGVPRKYHPEDAPMAATEHYLVTTTGPACQGLAWPKMYTIFRTAAQNESMEVSDAQLAMASRMIVEQHKIGFEVKAAALAHKQADFLWDQERSDGILNFFNGAAVGHVRVCTQFDHEIVFANLVKPDQWDAKKWNTVINRLMWWAGPLGFMLADSNSSGTMTPTLLQLLQTSLCHDRREYVGPHLEAVLNEWLPKQFKGATVQWGDQVFTDPKLAWDQVKTLTAQGSLSLRTGLERAKFDPDREAERKLEEAKPENKKKFMPLYDTAHGDPAGRPKGAKDGDGE